MPHRHLTERAGRELTKAAIADIEAKPGSFIKTLGSYPVSRKL